ncbi:hypothetical protein G6011_00061 [Alternaria panax]|uniref:Ankyrin repeat protein n=1 Tax=Alternaria panax TaxID=48097 RepID=A0AAD4IIC9_9PLEO|nr:hypothetical protein G6011_00061 [Alternaria panax]
MGAKVVTTDKWGPMAHHYAARTGNYNNIVAILETSEAREAKLIAKKNKHGQNVLHLLFWEHYMRAETVQWLLDEGADISELDDSGTSPLARLIQNYTWHSNTEEICRLILKIRRNMSFLDHDRQTLGRLCATTPNFEVYMLKAFNDSSVDLEKRDFSGNNVLHRAAISGSLTEESIEFLVDGIGIEASAEDTHGCTAFQYAIEEALKDHGSKIPNHG